MVAGGWATTVAMFLNTLKYKKIIGPKVALGAYAITFPFIVGSLSILLSYYLMHSWVAWLVMLGVPINFLPREWYLQQVYQMLMMALLYNLQNTIPDPYTSIIGSSTSCNGTIL